MKKKKRLLALIMIITIAITSTACSRNKEKNQEEFNILNNTTDNVQGNSNANITNGGIVAIQGDWLYFSAKDGLYKSKTDGSQKQKLCEGYNGGSVHWINVVDDWVYFASIGLYKVKTDGSEYQQIDSEDIRGVRVIGDWIYYGSEYRIKTDGSDKEKLDTRNSASGYTLNIVNGWIYFYDKDKDNNDAIFKMKTDGSNKQKIYTGRTDYMIVEGNWIYYVKYGENSLYKISINGTDGKLILNERISNLNVSGDWIYYNGDYNGKPALNKIKTDGSNKQLICYDNVESINIFGDWIYYQINGDSTDTIYKIKTDGSDKQIFFKGADTATTQNVEQKQDKTEDEIINQIQDSLEKRGQGHKESTIKEYNAKPISKDNTDSSSKDNGAYVYKLKIEDNNLIVWGSLDCKTQGSSKVEYLKDQKRTFKLADNVDLGLDWLGDRDKQIQYFNNGENLNSQVFSFRTLNGEVNYITFAG